MNYDEFAFFNQQLATMLQDGIPLEGALRQLAAGMQRNPLRQEIEQLEQELSRGVPIAEALSRRTLPEFYRRMVQIGARSNDLPGMLTVLADHYHRSNAVWTRLKGLMVYPIIVILVSLGITSMLTLVFRHFLSSIIGFFNVPTGWLASMWLAPASLGVLAVLGVAAVLVPSWRAALRWRLPPFREASLAQLASALALMLRNGMTLADALAFGETLEAGNAAGAALARWRAQVEAGAGKPTQWTGPNGPFPPLFLWLVQKGGEDAAAGFQKAADLYQNRAAYRTEMALYGALPISVLFLGQMIFWQIAPLMHAMAQMMNTLGDSGG